MKAQQPPTFNCRIEVMERQECSLPAFKANTSYCSQPDHVHMSDYNYVNLGLLAVYLLVGNVMLLNLLIAIFT